MFWKRFSRSRSRTPRELPLPGNGKKTKSFLKTANRIKLKNELDEIAAQCPDLREGRDGIIQDIIDPSLRVPRPKQRSSADTVRWIPAVFDVKQDKTCTIQSPINNIDYMIHHSLYQSIEELFSVCLGPMEVCLGMKLTEMRLQVIVKAQKYMLRNGQSYEGDVHREGSLQNHILGVCLYYYHINDVSGGDLLLGDDEFRYGYTAVMEDAMQPVTIEENSLVVFNNSECFHKVGRMTGTSDNSERALIAFFIINPFEHIPDSLNDVTLNIHLIWIRELRLMARNAGVELVEDVIRMIGKELLQSWDEAVLERSLFKEELSPLEIPIPESFYRHPCNSD